MHSIKIGIIKEDKSPPDQRTPLTPMQAREIEKKYPHVKIVAQASPHRSFRDEEYKNEGIEIVADISDCAILMGVKEVPIPNLIPYKTYLFFSHTIKKQPYNRNLLREMLKKNIRLIDYEALKNRAGIRLAAFGRYAGIVGAYNGLLAYGKRYQHYRLRKAIECHDLNDLKTELQKIKLPPIKILLTGFGRVAKGAVEVLDSINIRRVTPTDFLNNTYAEPVYTQLREKDYHIDATKSYFNKKEFYENPQNYRCTFNQYTNVIDLLISGTYWNSDAPVLFTREDMRAADFNIKVIADITCDIEGSIPSTKKPSTIADPFYDYDPVSDKVKAPFSSPHHTTVMAVDNLPCELPRSASEAFGRELVDKVIPSLVTTDKEDIIKRATVSMDGELTKNFDYLQDYVNEKVECN